MSRKSRQSLYRYQAHGLLDATGRCSGEPRREAVFDSELREVPCAICLTWCDLEGLDEDHAPQRKGQSNLGTPRITALTCKQCNQFAGRSYEGVVKNENDVLCQVETPFCTVHETWGFTQGGLLVARSMLERQLVDIKSAYLIAFATLGYRWAASPRLDRLRGVLSGRTGLAFARNEFDVICGCTNGGLEAHFVYEVSLPVPAVLVTGAHVGVLLPANRSPADVANTFHNRSDEGQVRLSGSVGWGAPWPLDYTGSRPVAQVWRAMHCGSMFHVGRCENPSRHRRHSLTAEELDLRLMPALRM